jgi:hypothetical protein
LIRLYKQAKGALIALPRLLNPHLFLITHHNKSCQDLGCPDQNNKAQDNE